MYVWEVIFTFSGICQGPANSLISAENDSSSFSTTTLLILLLYRMLPFLCKPACFPSTQSIRESSAFVSKKNTEVSFQILSGSFQTFHLMSGCFQRWSKIRLDTFFATLQGIQMIRTFSTIPLDKI